MFFFELIIINIFYLHFQFDIRIRCICVWIRLLVARALNWLKTTTTTSRAIPQKLKRRPCRGFSFHRHGNHVEKPHFEQTNRRRTLGSAMLKLKPFFRYSMKNDIDFTVYKQHNRDTTTSEHVCVCLCVEKLVGLNCHRSGDKCVGLPIYDSPLQSPL